MLLNEEMWRMSGLVFKAHPWHGITLGEKSPNIINAYIELVPGDTIKYELDKHTGYLKIDRPQIYSNICPSLYGMIPQTYSGKRVAEYCNEKTGRTDIIGDGDPIDICVLTEKLIPHGDVLLRCRPIGGLRMLDGGEADDKIIAVMNDDPVYNERYDISVVPKSVINRLKHYFLTYKQSPDEKEQRCEITHIYGREEAYEVIRRSHEDYLEKFPDLDRMAKIVRGEA